MTDKMTAGTKLNVNDTLVSSDGDITLVLQGDGNLVLYKGQIDSANAYWATNTEWLPAEQHPTTLIMQGDGQLVLQDQGSITRWGSGTWGPFTDPYLIVQNDGNMFIYNGDGEPIWASGVGNGQGAIPPRGQVTETGIDFTVDACGRLPEVVPGTTDVGSSTVSSVDVDGVAYSVTEQRRRMVNDVTEHAYLQDLGQMGVWPGKIIQGSRLPLGDLADVGPLARKAGTVEITTDLITNNPRTQSAKIDAPAADSVDKARQDLLTALNPSDSPGILKTSYESACTYREVGVKAGINVTGSAFGVDANASLNTTHRQSTVVATIRNTFYNVTFTPDSGGAKGFWTDTVTPASLRQYCVAGNPPLYIDSVQFGRFICVTAQGASSSADIGAALKAHYDAAVSGKVMTDIHLQQVLSSTDIKIYTLGVTGKGEFKDIQSIDDLANVYNDGLVFSMGNPGAPISFTCRHVADNSLAHVGLAAEYVQALSAAGPDVNGAYFYVTDGPGGGLVDTHIQVNPGDKLSLHGTGAFWNGVWFSGDTTPAGWPKLPAGNDFPVPKAPSYCLIARMGNAQWFAAGEFWEDTVAPPEIGTLQLDSNDPNMIDGDGRHWTVTVDVKRASAEAAGIYVG